LLAVFLTCLLPAGCAKQSPEAAAAQADRLSIKHEAAIFEPAEESNVDVDLMALSSTMVYAEVARLVLGQSA
jgi:hypothetical protein